MTTPLPLAWPPVDVAVAASLCAADPLTLLAEAKSLHRAGVDWLHVDIMDGHFVPHLGMSPTTTAALVTRQPLPIDVHLMVDEPLAYIEPLTQAGVSIITVHAEATRHLHRVVQAMRHGGVRAGVALNPATPIFVLEPILPLLDLVLLMGVDPGLSGQSFIPATIEKTKKLTHLVRQTAPQCVVQVDGGIGPSEAYRLAQAGARALVSGSFVLGAKSRSAAMGQLREKSLSGHKHFAAK